MGVLVSPASLGPAAITREMNMAIKPGTITLIYTEPSSKPLLPGQKSPELLVPSAKTPDPY